jgi:hypothetical protein
MENLTTRNTAPSVNLWLAVAGGIVSPILISNISRLLGIWGGNGVYLVALLVFLLLGCALTYHAQRFPAVTGGIAFATIGVGVFVDTILDFFLRAYDRNLWPLEIILWWLFAPIPMVLGAVTGKMFVRRKVDKEERQITR